jgi:malonate-semialdehyde dehydrogenase (acetylating) / methylmalonate-semialdehyde dehydrogenase
VDISPLITKEAKAKVEGIIEQATKENKVLLDGRGVKVAGFENGNFVGATVIDECRPGTIAYD